MTNTHSESDLEASHQQGELQRLIQELIADNNELKWRMYQIENSFDAEVSLPAAWQITSRMTPQL